MVCLSHDSTELSTTIDLAWVIYDLHVGHLLSGTTGRSDKTLKRHCGPFETLALKDWVQKTDGKNLTMMECNVGGFMMSHSSSREWKAFEAAFAP